MALDLKQPEGAQQLAEEEARFRNFFADAEGEWILDQILKLAHVDQSPFVPGDPQGTGVNIGRHDLAKDILKRCKRSDAEIVGRAIEVVRHG